MRPTASVTRFDDRDVEISIRNFARRRLIDMVKSQVSSLEGLYKHQNQSGHDSGETHGEIKAYMRMLSWLEAYAEAIPERIGPAIRMI